MTDVAGKVAFITGGASGIGLGIAQAFAAAGAKVVITYRDDARLRQAMALFAAHPEMVVHPLRLDVTDRAAVERAAAETQRLFGKVHILCNNAAVSLLGAMDEATYEDWDWMMGVNVHGVINTLMSFLPRIKAGGEGGHIVNVASMSAFIAGPLSGIYTATKYAVRGLTESLRYNLAPHKIGVSLVCPGLTRSRIFESARKRPPGLTATGFPMSESTLQKLASVHECGMDPEEVGRKTLEGVRRNDFYVFTHSEFKDEVRELADQIIAGFSDEAPDPRRLEIEARRRQAKEQAARAVAAL